MGRKEKIRQSGKDRVRELEFQNAESIAQSLKRRTELLEYKKGMISYSRDACKTEEYLKKRVEYFRLIRNDNLRRTRNRQKEGDEQGALTPQIDAGAGTMSDAGSDEGVDILSAVKADDSADRDDSGSDEAGNISNDAL